MFGKQGRYSLFPEGLIREIENLTSHKQKMLAAASHLFEYGVACIPIAQLASKANRAQALSELDDEISIMPEFIPEHCEAGASFMDGGRVNKRKLVMGGFAALGTASSFHNKFVRDMRLLVHKYALELFRALVRLPEFITKYPHADTYKLEQIIDRLMVRPIGDTPSAEAWHRDSSPQAALLDLIFGGWVNFSQHVQHFSCQLKSHHSAEGSSVSKVGFSPIHDKALLAELAASKSLIAVNPGEWLVFFDGIVHEINARKQKEVSARQFLGWRLTQEDAPLMGAEALEEVLSTGAIVPMKSGQMPPMYAKLHIVNWVRPLETWSVEAIRPDLLEEVRVAGTWRTLVPRYMPSLEDLDAVWTPYEAHEKELLYPNPI